MPSIFIWKATEPSTSKKQIRYYSGSNWILEDNDYSSKSYMFLDQIVIPGFNDSVITYHAKLMPQDWTGSDLLEVSLILYEHIKSDNYGSLERIGDWMRFTLKKEIDFDDDCLKDEIKHIETWMSNKQQAIQKLDQKTYQKPDQKPGQKTYQKTYQKPDQKKYSQKQNITHQNVELNFQEFLIKYNMPIPDISSELSTSNRLILNTINHKNVTSYNRYSNTKRTYTKGM